MSGLTDLNYTDVDNTTSRWSGKLKEYRPVEKLHRSTVPDDTNNLIGLVPTCSRGLRKSYESPVINVRSPITADSTPLQIWEGVVLNVDSGAGVIQVQLDAKIGNVPRHIADIELEWVSDQDMDLVRSGAVFYLTLFKRTKWGGSIENSQELRFRRRPSWSARELECIDDNATDLLSKMTTLPTAE